MSGDIAAPFSWDLSAPILSPAKRIDDLCFSVKDPSVVYHGGRWHLFCTIRSKVRSHQIEYLTFDKWGNANRAARHILRCRDNYFCAPQVFYFRPHRKWYLVYQIEEPTRRLKLQPAFSTTSNLSDPNSWSPPELFLPNSDPEGIEKWIDFWVICDEEKAYLFFSSLDGRIWRMWTSLKEFPHGFGHCELALQADIYEAAHIYRLSDSNEYLAVIEAQGKGGRRYYKAYTADRLDGKWRPSADTEESPFAGAANVHQPEPAWADSISHGEMIRSGFDETLTVDPHHLQFLIQGVSDEFRTDRGYGEIPWRLGLLTRRA